MNGARDVAVRVLVRVEKEHAFAAAALEAELVRAAQLDARDRSLATELVYGTLRVSPWLDAQLARFAPRGTEKLDARVRACMQLAAYQVFFMRVPAFAAVNEAVQAVSDARGPRVAAFANAVLRKVAAQAGSARAAEGADAQILEEAVVASTPVWLRESLERSLGVDEARAFLRCAVEPPAVALRMERTAPGDASDSGGSGERDPREPTDPRGQPDPRGDASDSGGSGERDPREPTDPRGQPDPREEWIERLRAAAPDAIIEPGRASPLAILVRGGGKPQRLPGFAEGAWSVQEEGSQVAALSVGAAPGETVLDACAGRGNKTGLLARAVGSTGAVDACDMSPAKLERLVTELTRIGLRARATYAVDWSVGSGEVAGLYDRVLVDAPCSGAGTLRRRPEIALRRQPEDLEALARTQEAIVRRAAVHVKPGGSLVYVVCSVLREEGEAVIDALLGGPDALPDFAAVAPPFRLLPHVHGTDGYFVATLVRR